MGEGVLAEGDGPRAASLFTQILDLAPDNAAAHGGLVRALLLAGETEAAQAAFDAVPAEIASDSAIAHAKSALALVADAPHAGALAAPGAAAIGRASSRRSGWQYVVMAAAAVSLIPLPRLTTSARHTQPHTTTSTNHH